MSEPKTFEFSNGKKAFYDVDGRGFVSVSEELLVQLMRDLDEARALLADFVDADECWYDHHGYCQAHMWFEIAPACPHKRARAVLGMDQ